MANEFIIKKGLISKADSVVSGSLIVTEGVSGSFSGSFEGDGSGLTNVTASFSPTASYALTASYVETAQNSISSSYALTASYAVSRMFCPLPFMCDSFSAHCSQTCIPPDGLSTVTVCDRSIL